MNMQWPFVFIFPEAQWSNYYSLTFTALTERENDLISAANYIQFKADEQPISEGLILSSALSILSTLMCSHLPVLPVEARGTLPLVQVVSSVFTWLEFPHNFGGMKSHILWENLPLWWLMFFLHLFFANLFFLSLLCAGKFQSVPWHARDF